MHYAKVCLFYVVNDTLFCGTCIIDVVQVLHKLLVSFCVLEVYLILLLTIVLVL
jgi:hypothetical protein